MMQRKLLKRCFPPRAGHLCGGCTQGRERTGARQRGGIQPVQHPVHPRFFRSAFSDRRAERKHHRLGPAARGHRSACCDLPSAAQSRQKVGCIRHSAVRRLYRLSADAIRHE